MINFELYFGENKVINIEDDFYYTLDNNILFEIGSVFGVVSNQFEIPITNKNLEILGYPNLNAYSDSLRGKKINCEIRYNNRFVGKGYIYISEINASRILVEYNSDNRNWINFLDEDFSIRDKSFFYPEIEHQRDFNSVIATLDSNWSGEYVYPLANNGRLTDTIVGNLTVLDSKEAECQLRFPFYDLLPCVKYEYVLRKIFQTWGYTLKGDLFDNAKFKKLYLYPDDSPRFNDWDYENLEFLYENDVRVFNNSRYFIDTLDKLKIKKMGYFNSFSETFNYPLGDYKVEIDLQIRVPISVWDNVLTDGRRDLIRKSTRLILSNTLILNTDTLFCMSRFNYIKDIDEIIDGQYYKVVYLSFSDIIEIYDFDEFKIIIGEGINLFDTNNDGIADLPTIDYGAGDIPDISNNTEKYFKKVKITKTSESSNDSYIKRKINNSLTPTQNIPMVGNWFLPDINVSEIIKYLTAAFGVIITTNETSKEVTFNQIKNISINNAVDLSDKVSTIQNSNFTKIINKAGKKTNIKYSESGDEYTDEYKITHNKNVGDGTIIIKNDFIEESNDIYESTFTSSLNNKGFIHRFLANEVVFGNIVKKFDWDIYEILPGFPIILNFIVYLEQFFPLFYSDLNEEDSKRRLGKPQFFNFTEHYDTEKNSSSPKVCLIDKINVQKTFKAKKSNPVIYSWIPLLLRYEYIDISELPAGSYIYDLRDINRYIEPLDVTVSELRLMRNGLPNRNNLDYGGAILPTESELLTDYITTEVPYAYFTPYNLDNNLEDYFSEEIINLTNLSFGEKNKKDIINLELDELVKVHENPILLEVEVLLDVFLDNLNLDSLIYLSQTNSYYYILSIEISNDSKLQKIILMRKN